MGKSSTLGKAQWQFKEQLKRVIEEDAPDKEEIDLSMRVSQFGYIKTVDFTNTMLAHRCSKGMVVEKEKVITKRLYLTFGIGHAVHDMIQTLVAKNGKSLFADWECPKCRAISTGIDICVCPACTFTGRFKYKEVYLKYGSGIHIGGHPDLIKVLLDYEDGNAGVFIIDIKTINDNNFKNLKNFGPSPEYIVQVIMYMFLVKNDIERRIAFGERELLPSESKMFGRIYYLNKNDSSELEFGIKYDEDLVTRCLVMYNYYYRCMMSGKIKEGTDVTDMNKTVVEYFGREKFMDLWYPL